MSDDQFMQEEQAMKEQLQTFRRLCEREGYDFADRIDDLVHMVKNDE